MSKCVLTSWKDIARYLGKGVRTVQRWEEYFGLPVRRPSSNKMHHAVIAIPEEIDAWLRSQTGTEQCELERLRDEVTRLRAELAALRKQPGTALVLAKTKAALTSRPNYLFPKRQSLTR